MDTSSPPSSEVKHIDVPISSTQSTALRSTEGREFERTGYREKSPGGRETRTAWQGLGWRYYERISEILLRLLTQQERYFSYRLFYLAVHPPVTYSVNKHSLGPDCVSRIQMRSGHQRDLSDPLDISQCAKWLGSF